MAELKGRIVSIVFNNEENGWTVMRLSVKGFNAPVTVVGVLPGMTVGTEVMASGEWKSDLRFGQQFAADSAEEILPSTLAGMRNYLGSGMIKGIGRHFARAIVDHFGSDTFDIIEQHPDRLLEVPNMGKKRVGKITESWARHRALKNVMVFLQGHGVSPAYAVKIYKRYGQDSIARVKENPFCLADDVWGIGFKTADSIARNMGYGPDDPQRCRAGIIYALRQLSDDGHVFATDEQLRSVAAPLLGISEQRVAEAVESLAASREVVLEENAVYLPQLYYAEADSALRLRRLISVKSDSRPSRKSVAGGKIDYDPVQLEAIEAAATTKVMVLTGGPGTGKTTTTKGIIEALKRQGKEILLAAPTGRAAKRLSEATGMDARTIHRLLEYSPADGWGRDEDNPIEGDALIVDECSMIDINLFHNLLRAIPPKMSLVFVGDIDQLPSVGPGNVLRDIIDSGVVKVVRLTRIFRQAQSSRIVMNAHAINQGQFPDISNGRDTDFFFIPAENEQEIPELIASLAGQRLPKAYGLKPGDIQVLTPMQRGPIGTAALNELLQQSINPGGPAISRGATVFRRGDKVMQIRNNYDKNVFNGDIGYIVSVDTEEKTLTVAFDNQEIEYEDSDLDELTLAYAVTIHKSQGSEFPAVVIPVTMKHFVMLQRNLIYTAITRSKRICVMVGSRRALAYAVGNQTIHQRNSRLRLLLQG